MAKETALWERLKRGVGALITVQAQHVDLQRLENMVTAGHPDVEGCINGQQIWIELKSESRPKKPETAIKFKVRNSQSIWHKDRHRAGFRYAWVLCQVGDGAAARLYLIPGWQYDKIVVPESDLEKLSLCSPTASPADVLMVAANGW